MPSLKLKPSEGPVGTDVTAIGTGFRPNVSYRIQLEDVWLKPGTVSNRGTFVTVLKIPAAPHGEQDIIAVSRAAHQLAHAMFRVIPRITQITPMEIVAGDVITVSGTGLGSNEVIQVSLTNRPVDLNTEARTKPDGTFTISFTATEDLVSVKPLIIRVAGQGTNASAQAEEEMEISLAS